VPGVPSRRAVLRTAALATTGVAALAACDDTGLGGSKSSGGAGSSKGSSPAPQTPTQDPAEVAALSAAAAALRQLSSRYAAVAKRYPALAARLSGPRALHAAHLPRLTALGGKAGTTTPPIKPVPAKAALALAELVATEQRLSVTHSTAAVARSGAAARLLAMVAASQAQIAVTLGRKAAGR